MARKSAASLSVIAGSIDRRPEAPEDLTALEAEVWERTVAHETADMFASAALQQLLKDYCHHVVTADRLSKVIEGHMAGEPDEGREPVSIKELDCLMKMRDRETRAISDKATKLRLTNQSRYTPQAAATASRKPGAPALWDRSA